MNTKKFILCIDELNSLINARLVDVETLELISQSEMGAWESERAAIDMALYRAAREGAIRD